MKLKKFREDCEKVGIDFKLVQKYYDDQTPPEDEGLEDWVTNYATDSADAFLGVFVWGATPEDHGYWKKFHAKLREL